MLRTHGLQPESTLEILDSEYYLYEVQETQAFPLPTYLARPVV